MVVGDTELSEDKVKDLLVLLDIIGELDDDNPIKEMFNCKKMLNKIKGDTNAPYRKSIPLQVKIQAKDIFTLVLLRAESYFSRSKFNPWRSYVSRGIINWCRSTRNCPRNCIKIA